MHFLLQTSCSYIYSGTKNVHRVVLHFSEKVLLVQNICVQAMCTGICIGNLRGHQRFVSSKCTIIFYELRKNCRNGQFFHAIQKFYSPIKTYPAIKHHFLPVKAQTLKHQRRCYWLFEFQRYNYLRFSTLNVFCLIYSPNCEYTHIINFPIKFDRKYVKKELVFSFKLQFRSLGFLSFLSYYMVMKLEKISICCCCCYSSWNYVKVKSTPSHKSVF